MNSLAPFTIKSIKKVHVRVETYGSPSLLLLSNWRA